MSLRKAMAREVGAAVAVLAIYVLTLLLPLHQAAGLQRDLAKLGYETVGAWTLCAPLSQASNERGDEPAALKCPATGVAKKDFVALLPPVIRLDSAVPSAVVPHEWPQPLAQPAVSDHPVQPRAPPVPV